MIDNSQETNQDSNPEIFSAQPEQIALKTEAGNKIQELEAEIQRLKKASQETQATALREVEALESASYAQEAAEYSKMTAVQQTEKIPAQTPAAPIADITKLSLPDLKTKSPQMQAQLLITYAAGDIKQTLKALNMAVKINNPYVIDALHDALVKNKS